MPGALSTSSSTGSASSTRSPPGWLADNEFLGLSLWQWIAGPSVAMCALLVLAIWTTSGTYMLFFLAGLQNIPQEVEEAAAIDGATTWQRFRYVTLPLMRRASPRGARWP